MPEEPLDIPEEDEKAKDMDSFYDTFETINQVITVSGLCDLYKSDTDVKTSQKLLYIFGFMNLFPLVCGEFVTLMLFFSDNSRILETSDVLPCFVVSCFSMAKSLRLILRREEVRSLVLDLGDMWPQSKIDSINKIVRENMISAKTYCKIYTFSILGVGIAYNSIPVMRILYYTLMSHYFGHSNKWNKDVSQPYGVWYPYDYGASIWIYIPTYISQFYAGIYVACLVGPADCFFCLLMAHVTMHFQLLHRRIRNLNVAHDDITLEEARDNAKEEIKEIVEYHQKLYIVSDRIEAIFSFVLLINLAISSLLICVEMFCLTIAPRDQLFKYVIFFTSCVSQISLMCYYGNRMTEESTAVQDAAYDCGWVDGGLALRSAVLMLISRAGKPAAISAMGFTTVSLGTFSSIVRASWSYFTLLHNLYDGQME